MWSRCLVIVYCVSLPLALGCGSSYEGPDRVPVSGSVTFDGQPLPEGHIFFVGEGENRSSDGIIANGQFTIPEKLGPNVGQYQVRIIAAAPSTGDPALEGGDATDELSQDDAGGGQLIPKKYNDQTTLTADISEGMEPLKFDLTSS